MHHSAQRLQSPTPRQQWTVSRDSSVVSHESNRAGVRTAHLPTYLLTGKVSFAAVLQPLGPLRQDARVNVEPDRAKTIVLTLLEYRLRVEIQVCLSVEGDQSLHIARRGHAALPKCKGIRGNSCASVGLRDTLPYLTSTTYISWVRMNWAESLYISSRLRTARLRGKVVPSLIDLVAVQTGLKSSTWVVAPVNALRPS